MLFSSISSFSNAGLSLALIPYTLTAAYPNLQWPRNTNLVISNGLPEGWTHAGCYTDSIGSRGLELTGTPTNDMTETNCINFCNAQGYTHAGVEFGRECRCGDTIRAPSVTTTISECDYPCTGAAMEACGGANRMNVFIKSNNANTTNTAPTSPISPNPTNNPSLIENPGVNGYNSIGCYTDIQAQRTLVNLVGGGNNAANTVRSCIDSCAQDNLHYAGVEFGKECFCGSAIRAPGGPAPPTDCNMLCTGNSTEKCGGPNRINIYHNSAGTNDTAPSPPLPPSGTTAAATGPTSITSAISSGLATAPSVPFPSTASVPFPVTTLLPTTNVSSVIPSSPASSTCGPISSTPSNNILLNAGFETGLRPWLTNVILGSGTTSISSSAYTGCSALSLEGQTSDDTVTQFEFSQPIAQQLTVGQRYVLSFYQGRTSATAGDGDSADPTVVGMVGGTQIGEGQACSRGGCRVASPGGSVWRLHQFQFTYGGGTTSGGNAVSIMVTYTTPGPFAPVLFDDITLTQG